MTTGNAGTRDRYIDCLRAIALVRVVVYHTFSWVWLPLVFPSMPIMFALAGALVAGSLDRSQVNPWPVLGRRIRRLLPPVWALGVVAVPLMLFVGWTADADRGVGSPLTWDSLLLWVVPLSEPPGSAWGYDWSEPLWYLATYLWLLLLSPSLLWLFRRWPLRTLAVPLLAVAAGTAGLWSADKRAGQVALDLATFGACWMLGFAHHDNRIRPIPLKVILPTSMLLLAAGLSWALYAPDPRSGPNIDDIPLADALWGVGAVLLLLRLYPDFSWLARFSWLDKTISAVNARAMTIYLWGNPAIFIAAPLIALFPLTSRLDENPVASPILYLAVTFALIILAVFIFGWVEDVAARRRPRLSPWPRNGVKAAVRKGSVNSPPQLGQREESTP
jgi:peptidoglycan/LPS O-acetylase OafA/YrhL